MSKAPEMRTTVVIAILLSAAMLAAQNGPISRKFYAMDFNKASHIDHQMSPWPDDCCDRQSTPVQLGAWRSLGAQVNWDQIAAGRNQDGAGCPPRNGADPNDPCYFWRRLDGYMRQATVHGEETIYTVYDTPPFANGGDRPARPPSDVNGSDKYLKDFLTAVYRHVTAEGWHIQYWECWNEPDNYPREYAGTMEELLHMCRDIQGTIRALDPTAKFISPGFTSADILGWRSEIDPDSCRGRECSRMQQYLEAGGGNYADIIGYHGYAFPDPVDPLFDSRLSSDKLRFNVAHLTAVVNQIVARTGNSGKPVWMTEGGDNLPPTSQNALANDDLHAAFVGRYLLEFMGRGTSLVTWYGWDFGGPHAFLAAHNGDSDDVLNKGGKAFRQIYDWTAGKSATMTRPCTPSGTLYTCTLTDAQGNTMLAMYDTSQDCSGNGQCETKSEKVPEQYTTWTDLEGGVHPISAHMVPIGRKPVLLQVGKAPAKSKESKSSKRAKKQPRQ